MNPCSCSQVSLPGSQFPNRYESLTGMASETFTACGVIVVDDNWVPRVLKKDGITVSKGGRTRNTDGSIKNGFIDLNPEAVPASDCLLGLLGTRLVRIGINDDPSEVIPEGSTFIYKGNQWQVVPMSELSRTYDKTKLKVGGRQLLSFSCSSGNNVEIGIFSQTPSTVIVIDENGLAQSYTFDQFSELLITPLCSSIPQLASIEGQEDETATAVLACSENGLRKVSTAGLNAYYLSPIQQVYYQGKYQGWSEPDITPGGVQYYPPIPPITPGTFASNYIDVDLTAIAGYNERATAVIVSLHSFQGIVAIVGIEQWHLVMIVGGEERIRLVSGAYTGSFNTAITQFVVAMPTDKKLRIEVQRQVSTAGTIQELAMAVAYIAGFRYD